MIKKCKLCKYYREGLNIDYMPISWCDLNNGKNAEICTHNTEEYTLKDYIFDILPGISILLLIIMINILCYIFS